MKNVVFFTFLICLTTYSQKSTPIYGTLLDSIGTIDNANIVNKNSKIGTNTNSNGLFKIFCQVGDTIVFTSVQHIKQKIIVEKSNLNSLNFKIYLKIKTYKLDEFELKKHNLLGILELDLTKIKQKQNNINAHSLNLPNARLKKIKKVDREIYTATSSNGLISLDLILNSLSGRLKKLKLKKKIVEQDEVVNKIFNNFKFYLTTKFKISVDDEYKFLYFCINDSLFKTQISKNKFEFIEFLQKKAIEFNKLKKE